MNSSTLTATPDETSRAVQTIQLGLALDPEARSQTLARLIAASLHDGVGTALEFFASSGHLNAEEALHELNTLRVPLEQEGWVDALGRYILLTAGGRS